MNEDQVKILTKTWLEEQGFKVHSEVSIGQSREVILDFFAFKDNTIEIRWIECKGDVNLSELLEGFIRVEYAVFDRGGLGILAIPHEATLKLLDHRKFLKQAENVIKIFDAEKGVLHQL